MGGKSVSDTGLKWGPVKTNMTTLALKKGVFANVEM
jgi:hypothetical protein